MKKNDKELVVCIVNNGYADVVMEAAKSNGATGGTICHGRGTGKIDAEKFFGIKISPDKEIVLCVVEATMKDKITQAIYDKAGLDTEGQGIVFTMPVDDFLSVKTKAK